MKILVRFGNEWTIQEIEKFLNNPAAPEFVDLDGDDYLELLACAECYLEEKQVGNSITDKEMNCCAMAGIASDIDANFTHELFNDYCNGSIEHIKEHLDEEQRAWFLEALEQRRELQHH